jgi:hypothetical protein
MLWQWGAILIMILSVLFLALFFTTECVFAYNDVEQTYIKLDNYAKTQYVGYDQPLHLYDMMSSDKRLGMNMKKQEIERLTESNAFINDYSAS